MGNRKRVRSLRFAVPTPWGVELDKDVLGLVHDDVVIVVRDDDDDGAVLLLGDGLALDAGLHLAVDEVLHEFGNRFLAQFLVLRQEGEFLVLSDLLDGKGGELVGREVQVAGVGAEGFGVNRGEVDLALVLFGDGLELEG